MKAEEESAVSPVVGVMLMLVVTIIIAAVVSAFAGGMSSDQAKTPQTTVAAHFVIDDVKDTAPLTYGPNYPADFTAKNGIMFENKGGDSFALKDIYIQVQYGDTKYDLTTSDEIQSTSGTCLPSGVTSYLMEMGDTDGYISPGDKFMLYSDNCFNDETYGNGLGFSWKPEGAANGMSVFKNNDMQYKIVHKESKKVIASGEVVVQ